MAARREAAIAAQGHERQHQEAAQRRAVEAEQRRAEEARRRAVEAEQRRAEEAQQLAVEVHRDSTGWRHAVRAKCGHRGLWLYGRVG